MIEAISSAGHCLANVLGGQTVVVKGDLADRLESKGREQSRHIDATRLIASLCQTRRENGKRLVDMWLVVQSCVGGEGGIDGLLQRAYFGFIAHRQQGWGQSTRDQGHGWLVRNCLALSALV